MGFWTPTPSHLPFACSTCRSAGNPPFHIGNEYIIRVDESGSGNNVVGKWTTCSTCVSNMAGAEGSPWPTDIFGMRARMEEAELRVDELTLEAASSDEAPAPVNENSIAIAVADELERRRLRVRATPGRKPPTQAA